MFMSLRDRKRRIAPTTATVTPTATAAPATRESPVQVAATLATLDPAARDAQLAQLQSARGNYFVTSVLAQMPMVPEAGDADQSSAGSTSTESTSGGNALPQAKLAELQAQLSQIMAQIESIEHTLETIQDPAQRGTYEEQLEALQLQAAALQNEIVSLTGMRDDGQRDSDLPDLQQRIYAQVVAGSKA